MNAAVLRQLGEPPCFEQFEEPVPGPDEALVQVLAASLKPVDKQMASGSHYASFRELPAVCGVDGVEILENGSRVFFCRTTPAVWRHGATYRGGAIPLLADPARCGRPHRRRSAKSGRVGMDVAGLARAVDAGPDRIGFGRDRGHR
jgi:hypothetical protein